MRRRIRIDFKLGWRKGTRTKRAKKKICLGVKVFGCDLMCFSFVVFALFLLLVFTHLPLWKSEEHCDGEQSKPPPQPLPPLPSSPPLHVPVHTVNKCARASDTHFSYLHLYRRDWDPLQWTPCLPCLLFFFLPSSGRR